MIYRNVFLVELFYAIMRGSQWGNCYTNRKVLIFFFENRQLFLKFLRDISIWIRDYEFFKPCLQCICPELFHDGGPYHIETSPLICRANQWTGFFMIGTSAMEEFKSLSTSPPSWFSRSTASTKRLCRIKFIFYTHPAISEALALLSLPASPIW